MNLKPVSDVLPNTRVFLRMDVDVPMADGVIEDNARLVKSIPTINILLGKECQIFIGGHLGRPEGKEAEYSLRPVYLELMSLLEPEGIEEIGSVFVDDVEDEECIKTALAGNQIIFLENLRFWSGEKEGDDSFLRNITSRCQNYVNDSFDESHRKAASIMLFKKLPAFYGLSFIDEVTKIEKVIHNPEKPLVVILGGAKEDKLGYLDGLIKIADQILIGGKLPKIANYELRTNNEKVVWAKLREDGLDLNEEDINKFREIISGAKMIIWAGAMGKYEDVSCQKGTEEIAKAVANSNSYKIIAGGDTGASIKKLGLDGKIDFICSGGGVMLELLTKGTLPAWE